MKSTGFSRIYLRLHYPRDVLAVVFIGFAGLALSVWLFERLKKKTDKELKKGGLLKPERG